MPKNKEKKRVKKAYNLKLNLKAISEVLSALKDYLFPYEKISKKFSKINSESDLAIFIKEKSAFVTQSTLYGYLKTRMGLKQNLMFTDDVFVDPCADDCVAFVVLVDICTDDGLTGNGEFTD